MSPAVTTIVLLLISNVFMTLAWYGHLRLQQTGVSSSWPLWVVILFSWGIALCEYSFMIPANRIGFRDNGGPYSLVQLKVMQEAISLIVFTLVAMVIFQGFTLRWNHLLAFLMLVGAVYLVFME
ncbi:MAG: DMT family protein [Muribaculaceae bacterium]